MGLFSAMTASVSGMAAQANALAAVSENISNSSTTGYKQALTQLNDLVDQAGVSGTTPPMVLPPRSDTISPKMAI